ncbi:MAG: YihY/virulence factor BrkB family protein [Trueperaceae bacterium]|nr:YihY/virulence factor BrkB family protein [Trueperaceae bacterium]
MDSSPKTEPANKPVSAAGLLNVMKQTVKEWQEDKVSVLAASLAYYTIFSLAPMLILLIALISLFFDQSYAREYLIKQFQSLFGADVAGTLTTMIDQRSQLGGNTLATVIGGLLMLVGATGAFSQLQTALNIIWNVKEEKKSTGIGGWVKVRLLSFGLIIVIGFLLLVSLLVSTFISVLGASIRDLFPNALVLTQAANIVLSLAIISLLFALIFKFLPDVKTRWRDVWLGSVVTAILFVIGKALIGLYLGNGAVTSSYGAAGSLVVILLWVYYSAQILLFGGEFTQVYANQIRAGKFKQGEAGTD